MKETVTGGDPLRKALKGPLCQFKIALKGIVPSIWRRVLVPEEFSMGDLHMVIQDTMGWWDSHLHEFIWNRTRIGVPDPETDRELGPCLDESVIRIMDLGMSPKDRIRYEYDFGDSWEHGVVREKKLDLASFDGPLPFCLKGKRQCPPEDIGGVWGYQEMLEALASPGKREYREILSMVPDGFDPEFFEAHMVNVALGARKWVLPGPPSGKVLKALEEGSQGGGW